jgi:hypothetical protein
MNWGEVAEEMVETVPFGVILRIKLLPVSATKIFCEESIAIPHGLLKLAN